MDSIKAPAGRKIPFFLLTIGGPSFPNLFRPFFIVQSTTGCPPIADFGPLKSISSIRPSKIHLISQVQKLQKELQEEIDLHFALANAVAQASAPLSDSPSQIPAKA
ncbi:uncharacterized protein LOC131225777 isoform X4 [Magnolia sinica]|uniref:uncharacterized protein LOC131225777 isoform X4 n=1 Tax=Magnolia sinica TaxID=86752 RepID=UPI002658DD9B|nr:uncharacterized protein LOC131225777 isoform X4 [Magnolia sinica]